MAVCGQLVHDFPAPTVFTSSVASGSTCLHRPLCSAEVQRVPGFRTGSVVEIG